MKTLPEVVCAVAHYDLGVRFITLGLLIWKQRQ